MYQVLGVKHKNYKNMVELAIEKTVEFVLNKLVEMGHNIDEFKYSKEDIQRIKDEVYEEIDTFEYQCETQERIDAIADGIYD